MYASYIETVHGKNSVTAGQTYFWLGHFYSEANAIEKANKCFLKTVAIYEHFFGKYDQRVGDCFFNLALAYKQQVMLAPAQSYLEQALEVYVRAVGRNSMQVANCYLTLGKVFIMKHEFPKAISALKQSSAIKQELLRSKTHKEVRKIELLISGVNYICGTDPDAETSIDKLVASQLKSDNIVIP